MDQTVTAGRTVPLALKGVRIVDFSWVLAGPMTTKLLATMGAEVIKIETSLRPEYVRRGRFFPIINNTKRSCTINLKTPSGQDLIRRLIAVSDMVVENFSAGVLVKYGLGYEELKVVQPDLIFVSASGLGRTGPQRDALAYGTLLQAYSGRASMIGEINSELEGMGIPGWTDPLTATWESVAILAALYHRRRTGAGAYIDLSMLEGTASLLPEALLRQALGDPAPSSGANRDIGHAPVVAFAAPVRINGLRCLLAPMPNGRNYVP
jgi:benzylsuccinate CoA-transferase BbsF subunit